MSAFYTDQIFAGFLSAFPSDPSPQIEISRE